jgi:hypothetical protein
MKVSEAIVQVSLRMGFVLPSKPFIKEACKQIIHKNREVFETLAKQ